MKKHLCAFFINFLCLIIVSNVLGGIRFLEGYKTIALAAGILTLVNLLIRPLINLFLLPVNLLTLGLFRWLTNVISLWLVTLVIPQFEINSFLFPGWKYQGLIIPEIPLSRFWVLVIASFLISLINNFLLWLTK